MFNVPVLRKYVREIKKLYIYHSKFNLKWMLGETVYLNYKPIKPYIVFKRDTFGMLYIYW